MAYIYSPKLTQRSILSKRRYPLQCLDPNLPHRLPPRARPHKRVRILDPHYQNGAEPLDIGNLRDTLYAPYGDPNFESRGPVNCVLDGDDFDPEQDFCQHGPWQTMQPPQLRIIPLPNEEGDLVLPFGFHRLPVPTDGECSPPTAPSVLIHELLSEHRMAWDLRSKPRTAVTYSCNPQWSAQFTYVSPNLDVPALCLDIEMVTISLGNKRLEPFMQSWGPIVVTSCVREPISLNDILKAIYCYFNKKLSGEEIARCTYTPVLRAKIQAAYNTRLIYTCQVQADGHYRRVDLLEGLFKFRGLQVDAIAGDRCKLRLSLGDS